MKAAMEEEERGEVETQKTILFSSSRNNSSKKAIA